jgi:hypothetical protein
MASVLALILIGCAEPDQQATTQLAVQQAQEQAELERQRIAKIADLSNRCQQSDLAACGELSSVVCASSDQETCAEAKALDACQRLRAAAQGLATGQGPLIALAGECIASARRACRSNAQDYCTFLCDAGHQDGCAQYVVNAQAEKAEALQQENLQAQSALELQRENSEELHLRQAEHFQVQQNNNVLCQLGNQGACLTNVLNALLGQ